MNEKEFNIIDNILFLKYYIILWQKYVHFAIFQGLMNLQVFVIIV